MPVPVPPKQPAHPVYKNSTNNNGASFIQSLDHSFPPAPADLPLSFGTREQWISSLPSWRRSKPRRIWEDESTLQSHPDFHKGLATAVNAPAIKGFRAQACIPPLYPVATEADPAVDADDEMSPLDTSIGWGGAHKMEVDLLIPRYERGAFTPIFEDQSPDSGFEHSSSPMVPATPFGDFVDRAVAAAHHPNVIYNPAFQRLDDGVVIADNYATHGHPVPTVADISKEPVPAPTEVATPSATTGYKKLAEPLAKWVANYIWKACTTSPGQSPHAGKSYVHSPPDHLVTSVHSLLLSTLLQPSAVFLALWYITRLPVYFGDVGLGDDHVKELRFRGLLLGDEYSPDKEPIEMTAPFRLAVLGCMLANKWLDDHTFSNKTWHSISNVPIHILNRLESFALDIFSYDLSVSSTQWSQWLSDLIVYHASLSSPSFPQPISRPSSNPHSIVRKALDEIFKAPGVTEFKPEPIFLGLEERRLERAEKEHALLVVDVALGDIDFDEDGPLRQEYLPKRRVVSTAHSGVRDSVTYGDENRGIRSTLSMGKPLPPPAKWSPAADEPILRDRNRGSGHYVAVQPPPAPTTHMPFQVQVMPPYHTMYSAEHSWPVPPATVGYLFDPVTAMHHLPAPVAPSAYGPMVHGHSRSQSLSGYLQHDTQSLQQNRMRSFSQSRFDQNVPPPPAVANAAQTGWAAGGHYEFFYPHAVNAFTSYCGIGGANCYQPSWLRA